MTAPPTAQMPLTATAPVRIGTCILVSCSSSNFAQPVRADELLQYCGAGGGLPPLPLSVEPGSARLLLADREAEAVAAAGLKGIGSAGGMGRRGLDRALRILPGLLLSLAHPVAGRPFL